MKKLWTILLAGVLVCVIAACNGGGAAINTDVSVGDFKISLGTEKAQVEENLHYIETNPLGMDCYDEGIDIFYRDEKVVCYSIGSDQNDLISFWGDKGIGDSAEDMFGDVKPTSEYVSDDGSYKSYSFVMDKSGEILDSTFFEMAAEMSDEELKQHTNVSVDIDDGKIERYFVSDMLFARKCK